MILQGQKTSKAILSKQGKPIINASNFDFEPGNSAAQISGTCVCSFATQL